VCCSVRTNMAKPTTQPVRSYLPLTQLPWKAILFCIGLATLVAVSGGERSVYDWMPYDNFDKVDDMYRAITEQNCKSKPTSELRLPYGSVGQLPKFNRLLSYIVYPNRTKLLHVHNMALNRAFFFRCDSYYHQDHTVLDSWSWVNLRIRNSFGLDKKLTIGFCLESKWNCYCWVETKALDTSLFITIQWFDTIG